MNLNKYLRIFQITLQEYLVYRLNFVLWRFRSFIFFLTLIFFWLAVYGSKNELLGYQKSQMLTYVVGVAFLRGVVIASRIADLSRLIRDGDLSKIILLPVNIFKVFLSWDFSDKFLNISFAIFEISLVSVLFHFPIYFPATLWLVFLSLITVVIAFFLYFFLNMTLSITAFWTDDIWSTRWLFGVILLEFFSGAVFPIDVLPGWLAGIIYLTPFPYLIFFPLKIWLGQIPINEVYKTMFICLVWLAFFYWLAHFLWRKGIKTYCAHKG